MTEEMIGRECCGSSAGVGSRRASASTLNERTGLDGPASGRTNRESIPSEHAQGRQFAEAFTFFHFATCLHTSDTKRALVGGVDDDQTSRRHRCRYMYRYRISTPYTQTILNAPCLIWVV